MYGVPYVNNHRLEKVLARGATAEVWSAVRLGPGGFAAPVALKTLMAPHATSAKHVRAFVNEARAASYVQHRNVVQTRELMCEDGRYWLSMERVRGWSVRALMAELARRGQAIPVEVAVALARDAAAGLQAIHDAGLIHRNVTPDNLMIATSGHLVVLDFGCATWQLSERVRYSPPLAPIDPAYASPEMRAGTPLDPRADVYSLGALLHQLVPRRPDVPVALDGIIAHALEVEPTSRFASARELEIVLELVSIRERWPVTASYVAAYLAETFAGAPEPVIAPPLDVVVTDAGDTDADDTGVRASDLRAASPSEERDTDPVIRAAPERRLPTARPAPRRFVELVPRTASGTRSPRPRVATPITAPCEPPDDRRAPTHLGKTRVRLVRR
jgi:serine/threonine protein kinase